MSPDACLLASYRQAYRRNALMFSVTGSSSDQFYRDYWADEMRKLAAVLIGSGL